MGHAVTAVWVVVSTGNEEGLIGACLARPSHLVRADADLRLDRARRASGHAGPLRLDASRVADLTVYLRQSHGDRDLAALGALVLGQDP